MSHNLLSDAIPDDNIAKDWVYAIETRQGSRLSPQEEKEFPLVHFERAMHMMMSTVLDHFPELFQYVPARDLYREIFECYHYCTEEELEDFDLNARSLMEHCFEQRHEIFKAYHQLKQPIHPWVIDFIETIDPEFKS